jgi:hypothetical protein
VAGQTPGRTASVLHLLAVEPLRLRVAEALASS